MEYEIKPAQRLGLDIKELWDFRELFFFFTWRDIKIKYKQTVLGALWAILQPFLLMLVFTFFFNHALKVPSENIPYPIFVFTGLMLWNVFAGGISNAGNSMVNNANIIKKIYFPRLIIPVSAILASLVDYMMTFIILIGMLIYYHAPIHFSTLIIGLPLSLLITLMTTFGLECKIQGFQICHSLPGSVSSFSHACNLSGEYYSGRLDERNSANPESHGRRDRHIPGRVFRRRN